MVTLRFTNEYANLLILLYGLFLLLFVYARRRKRTRAMKFGNYETLKKVAGRNFIDSSKLLFVLHLIAITSLIVGVSSPVLIEQQPTASSDYVLAIDASASMFTSDIKPSRFVAARETSEQFIRRLGNNSRVGVVTFGGDVTTVTDGLVPAPQARQQVQRIEMSDQAGTAIGSAIVSATNMLLDSNRSRRVLLITDGKNNAGVSLNESIEFARQHNTTIYAIGIGSTQNATDRFAQVDGQNASRAAFPNINRDQLTRLAAATGGNVSFVTNRSSFESALVDMTHAPHETRLTPFFVFFGVLLLLLDWIFKTTDYASLP